MTLKYEKLSSEISNEIIKLQDANLSAFASKNTDAIRRDASRDVQSAIRTSYIRDIDKILHCPFYNRYTDKTQVLSFYKNDDITHRAYHVQLVSRIARTFGKALGLNTDLIEAIALGHDIGHTPFGHAGERILDEISFEKTGRHFSHNIHSVRVLDGILHLNLSLQTLDGIACHDGEFELNEYSPKELSGFEEFDRRTELCYKDKSNIKKLIPSTLEGCVVRISDIIAYLGKDRQDAQKAKLIDENEYKNSSIGTYNAEIINNLTVNIIENSFGKPYIKMDKEHFEALKSAKNENYDLIYKHESVNKQIKTTVEPMMKELYEKLLSDLNKNRTDSPIYTHHIDLINGTPYNKEFRYEDTEHNQIVIDYIASMTDDYFIDLFNFLFPNSKYKIEYKGYFD